MQLPISYKEPSVKRRLHLTTIGFDMSTLSNIGDTYYVTVPKKDSLNCKMAELDLFKDQYDLYFKGQLVITIIHEHPP
jgi:hypothetical protein